MDIWFSQSLFLPFGTMMPRKLAEWTLPRLLHRLGRGLPRAVLNDLTRQATLIPKDVELPLNDFIANEQGRFKPCHQMAGFCEVGVVFTDNNPWMDDMNTGGFLPFPYECLNCKSCSKYCEKQTIMSRLGFVFHKCSILKFRSNPSLILWSFRLKRHIELHTMSCSWSSKNSHGWVASNSTVAW